MTHKTRRHIWSVPLVAAIAIVGVLAAFVVLANDPGVTMAQGSGDPCAGMTDEERSDFILDGGTCGETPQLDPPANVQAVDQDVTSLEITWDAVEGASGYRVEYQGPDDDVFTVVGTVNATTALITGLTPDTLYTIRVTALGVADQSTDSEPAEIQANTPAVTYGLTVNDVDDLVLNEAGRHTIRAEVTTDSPAEQTTVAVRIDNSEGTMYLDDPHGITYTQSGLRGIGERSEDVGNLVIDIRDDATRVFTLNVTCTDGDGGLRGVLDIEIRDDQQMLVAEATITCADPVEPPPPLERVSACYTISGMPDRGDDPATAEVEGQDIELLTTDKSVVLTVSSYEKAYRTTTIGSDVTIEVEDCPDWPQTSVFIRLVDQPGMMPMVDDDDGFVDENGLINDHGQVVGVSSGGELVLDIEDTVSPPAGSEDPDFGVRRGTFLVFTPDDVQTGDRYFVELYDNLHSQRINHQNALTEMEQDYERVVYCDDPATAAGACEPNTPPMAVGSIAAQELMAGGSVTVDVMANFSDADTGDTLTYAATSSAPAIAGASASGSMVTISAVSAGSAVVTVSATDMEGAYATQTIMVTVTAAELGAPTGVMATVDDSDPGAADVTVTWTDGANADRHVVFLFTADASLVGVNSAQTDGTTTFMNVVPGSYVAVVVAVENGPTGNAADIEMTQVMVTVN